MKQQGRVGFIWATITMAALMLALPTNAAARGQHDDGDRAGHRTSRSDDRHDRQAADAKDRRHHAGHKHHAHAAKHRARHAAKAAHRQEDRHVAWHASHARHSARHWAHARNDRRFARHAAHARHGRHFARDASRDRGDRHATRHAVKHERRAGYYCKPCENRFETRKGLQRHLHRAHRVPFRRFSRVIVNRGLSWIFFG